MFNSLKKFLRILGPGIITGAADEEWGILRPRTRRIGKPTSFPGKGFLLMNAGI
jgi:hypothetical protein